MNIQNIRTDNQRTSDWRIERLGKFTGSRIGDLMKSGRSKTQVFGETAISYIYEVMAERGLSSEVLGSDEMWDEYLSLTTAYSKAMAFGTDNEADALDEFEKWLHRKDTITISGVEYPASSLAVIRTGSIDHPTIPNFAASPDSVIVHQPTGEVLATVESKVPLPKTYIKYKVEVKDAASLKSANETYYYQTHAEMMCAQTPVTFFVVYQPFLSDCLAVAVIEKNEDTVKAMEERIALAEKFIEEHNG